MQFKYLAFHSLFKYGINISFVIKLLPKQDCSMKRKEKNSTIELNTFNVAQNIRKNT